MGKINVDFERMVEARKAVDYLRSQGYKDAHLDAADRFLGEYSEEINFVGSNALSLSALVLKSKGYLYSPDKGPLIAADPMVSGMGTCEEMGNANTRLRVSVEDDKAEEIKNILKQMGGTV